MSISLFKKSIPGSGFDAFGYPLKYDTAAEAGCEISRIPEEGLVFYAPLDKEASTAVTGQTLSKSGTITYEEVDGIPMARFDSGYIEVSNAVPEGNNPFSVSFCAKMFGETDSWPGLMKLSLNSDNFIILYTSSERELSAGAKVSNEDVFNLLNISDDLTILQHFVLAYSDKDGVVRAYRNGSLVSEVAVSGELQQQSGMFIGRSTGNETFPGAISAVRVYNHVLSETEIKALAKEFKI